MVLHRRLRLDLFHESLVFVAVRSNLRGHLVEQVVARELVQARAGGKQRVRAAVHRLQQEHVAHGRVEHLFFQKALLREDVNLERAGRHLQRAPRPRRVVAREAPRHDVLAHGDGLDERARQTQSPQKSVAAAQHVRRAEGPDVGDVFLLGGAAKDEHQSQHHGERAADAVAGDVHARVCAVRLDVRAHDTLDGVVDVPRGFVRAAVHADVQRGVLEGHRLERQVRLPRRQRRRALDGDPQRALLVIRGDGVRHRESLGRKSSGSLLEVSRKSPGSHRVGRERGVRAMSLRFWRRRRDGDVVLRPGPGARSFCSRLALVVLVCLLAQRVEALGDRLGETSRLASRLHGIGERARVRGDACQLLDRRVRGVDGAASHLIRLRRLRRIRIARAPKRPARTRNVPSRVPLIAPSRAALGTVGVGVRNVEPNVSLVPSDGEAAFATRRRLRRRLRRRAPRALLRVQRARHHPESELGEALVRGGQVVDPGREPTRHARVPEVRGR